jgi:hypothetical protein
MVCSEVKTLKVVQHTFARGFRDLAISIKLSSCPSLRVSVLFSKIKSAHLHAIISRD